MQQPDNLFWIGRKVGELEGRVSSIEKSIAVWRSYSRGAFRWAVLALLWASVIGAGASREEIADMLARVARKVLGI